MQNGASNNERRTTTKVCSEEQQTILTLNSIQKCNQQTTNRSGLMRLINKPLINNYSIKDVVEFIVGASAVAIGLSIVLLTFALI